MKPDIPRPGDFHQAFLEDERQVRINTGRLACVLVIVLMPFGVALDYFVYPDRLWGFLQLRLLCSAIMVGVLLLHWTRFARQHYPVVGLPIVILPAFFITWMIYVAPDGASPYYAGLNLILLAVSAVGHWSILESVCAVSVVIAMYLSAHLLRGPSHVAAGLLFNNVYFLGLTGVIVITGNFLFNRLRFREFALRFELDRNRKELEETNRRLLELDQAKSRFFANISHELRTPLTLLIAPLETLRRRFETTVDEETSQLLHTMEANGMRLLKLINDLLDLVRLESGRMEVKREPLDLAAFVGGIQSSVRSMAREKGIDLEGHVEPDVGRVLVDRDKLEKIVLNLVFNALKFTPAGGRIDIRATRQEDKLAINVRDSGMGIAKKNLPYVFDRFWQADDSSRRKFQGMGIGLALVKELVEIQDGNVTVDSQEGKGTIFTLHLPFLSAPPAEVENVASVQNTKASDEWVAQLYRRAELFPAINSPREMVRPVEAPPQMKRPTVLVADDEPDMLRFLKSQLAEGFNVVEAVNGQQAIDKAAQFLPDIVVLDMMMPEKDGLQACKELRERAATRSIPILLLTARADEDTKLAALAAGASDFLPKPFSTTELHVRIKNLVSSYDYQRELAQQNQVLAHTIEQLKATETQLVQHEKLASLGRMSAGIIHEINNPLNFASTGLYTLRNKAKYLAPEQQPEYAEILNDVEEGLKRIKNIVTDLRSFSHHENDLIEPLDVPETVQSALRFLSHEWRDGVRLELSIPDDLKVWGNRNKLIQVLVNLVQNSLDAVKQKQFGSGESPTIWISGKEAQGRSILQIRDNGDGIDAKHMDKIFDPFFTTKDVGKGMGLGLSIVYRIVEEFGGSIAVRSEPGQFCEFTLEFPVKGGA